MAHDGIEVEIKIKLSGEAELLRVKTALEQAAKFEKRTRQVDEYFTPIDRDFLAPEFPYEWLSIRQRGGRSILSYKHYHPENARVTTHCDELETEISDAGQMRKIFLALGCRSRVVVEKERETYAYKDEFEIALDTVKGLGVFIEIEAMKDFGGVEKTRKKLLEFAGTLGLQDKKQDLRGYPFLLLEKNGE